MSERGKPRLLTDGEAKTSLAVRLGKRVDRLRQIDARLGFRPYRVFLVWTTWDGIERGEGDQRVVCRAPLLPVPLVQDLTSLTKTKFSAGKYPTGSLRISEIATCYTAEVLAGRVLPDKPEDQVPHPYQFFYEVVMDGRLGCEPERRRFNLSSEPWLDAENFQWVLVLEKTTGDMARDGKPVPEPVVPPENPWVTRKLPAPDDDF